MTDMKILGFGMGTVLVFMLLLGIFAVVVLMQPPESASLMSVVGGSKYDVSGDGRVNALDVKYCLLNGDIRCDFNGNGILFDDSDRSQMANAITSLMPLSWAACSPEERLLINADLDCSVGDMELLDAIDRWAEEQTDDFCLLEEIDNWAGRSPIEGCIAGAPNECVDSDGGLDYYTKGTVTGQTSGTSVGEPQIDRCSSSDDLLEGVCESSTRAGWSTFSCPSGCSDGVCLTATTSTTSTVPPDVTTTIAGPEEPLLSGIFEALNSALSGLATYASELVAGLSSFLGLSIGNFASGTSVTPSVTVTSSVSIDDEFSDGAVTYTYGKWALYRGTTLVNEGAWEQLSSATYSPTQTFSNLQDGNYAFIGVIVRADANYNYQTGQWSEWTASEVGKTGDTFTIGVPQPPTPPTMNIFDSIIDFFSGVTSWIFGLFG